MTGLYLSQLYDAIVARKAALNVLLTGQSLTGLDQITEEPAQTARLKRPYALVRIEGERDVEQLPMESGCYAETIPIEVEVRLDGTQSQALKYEGIIKQGLEVSRSALVAAVTDATVSTWQIVGSTLELDEEIENRNGWLLTIECEALIQWSST